MTRGRMFAASGAAIALSLALACVAANAAPAAVAKPPVISHIWNIVLENEDYASTFGTPAADPYLAKTLPSMGALLEDYYGTGHESNDNYVSLVSGQPPNLQNQADCQFFSDFVGCVVEWHRGGFWMRLSDQRGEHRNAAHRYAQDVESV